MDVLRPGHAHRSSSDRLLNNYLESQKQLATALLTLLSHSYSSTSSLLAYVTSSPGVLLSVRRAVRHAAFEGPSGPGEGANGGGDTGSPGWAAYVSSLEDFRQDLKQIHLLEEEMSRVKRDREILVTRLIKQTKTRPTKSDIKDMATTLSSPRDRGGGENASILSSETSIYSGSDTGKEGKREKRAHKLAEAQAELLGCEEHLRSLEVRIESERNKVMYRGLEERFRAMETVAQMWLAQARRGLEDLEKLPELPMNTSQYELESNGSIAPSQSASQVGYDDPSQALKPQHRPPQRPFVGMHTAGSVDDSIAEEEEAGSSDDEPAGTLVVHENRRGPATQNGNASHNKALPSPRSPTHVQPHAPPPHEHAEFGRISPSKAGGRRAVSEIGRSAYTPRPSQPLRRTMSNEYARERRRGGSDTSSIRSTKKKGFFASIARFFKGPKPSKRHSQHQSARASSPVQRAAGGAWQTRTDTNIKRASTLNRNRRRSDSSSSEDEDMSRFVAVPNDHSGGWNVADVGIVREPPGRSTSALKRSASAKSRSTVVSQSQSTVVGRNRAEMTGSRTPTQATVSRGNTVKSTPGVSNTIKSTSGVSRSNTVKSTKSNATLKANRNSMTPSAAPTSSAVAEDKPPRTRKNGSIARTSTSQSQRKSQGPNIMSIVDMPPPAMPDVPRAPSANPQMEIVKAPGSSRVPHDHPMPQPLKTHPLVLPSDHIKAVKSGRHSRYSDLDDELRPSDSISRSNSARTAKSSKSAPVRSRTPLPNKDAEARAVSPLPPSKLRSPPLKSALRPTSPAPPIPDLPPPVVKPLYSVTAPGPVHLPPEPEPEPKAMEPRPSSRGSSKRKSGESGDEGASIYESAMEEDDEPEDTDDDDVTELGAYEMVENERVARRNEIVAAAAEGNEPVRARKVSETSSANTPTVPPKSPDRPTTDYTSGRGIERGTDQNAALARLTANSGHPEAHAVDPNTTLAPPTDDGNVVRRKSVRINEPEDDGGAVEERERERQREQAFADAAAAGANDSDDSLEPRTRLSSTNWDTRIGRMREDTSEDEDIDPDYRRARKGLLRHSGQWELASDPGRKKKKSTGGSVKRYSSQSSKTSKTSKSSRR